MFKAFCTFKKIVKKFSIPKLMSMKKTLIFLSLFILTSIVLLVTSKKELDLNDSDKVIVREKEESGPFTDAVGAALHQIRMTRDPKTGRVPEGVREAELAEARQNYLSQLSAANAPLVNTYSFQGPDNLGGRNRSIVYDVRYDGVTNLTIMSGGVSGGIFKSTDDGATWVRKSPVSEIYSVTSIAQDPRPGNQNTWYYSTGEALGNSASAAGAFYLGHGIYKSTDNGETWTKLANSNTGALESFDRRQDLINKVVVHPTTGDVYMAALDGIYRSLDGGATWSIVLFSGAGSIGSGMGTDIVITSTGRIYAAFPGGNNASPTNMPGVWTSTTGASGSWTKIAGATSASNPATWNANGAYGRVVLAVPPSAEDTLYAVYFNNVVSNCGAPAVEAELFRWRQSTSTWTDLSANLPNEAGCSVGNDPFAVQQGYDLVMAVKPGSPNTVFLGGTNLYRSTDGFTSTANTTRIGGYANTSGYSLYANSHPDIHAIAFRPSTPDIMLCGNDGGIQRTNDNNAATVAWTQINNGFRTYQYYYVAIDPRNANSKVIGGAQDNGTTRNVGGSGVNFESVFSGDGVSVGLSNLIAGNTFEYVGFQLGEIYRRNALSVPNAATYIRPTTAASSGLFATLFYLDPDNTQTLYYASDSSLYRNTAASTATTANWTLMTGVGSAVSDNIFITALATTRGTYSPATASLFIGTEDGRVLRLDDPANAAAATAPVDITGASFAAGGYISSIAVNPRNDDTVIVTFSNYQVSSTNIVNIWWTGNANSATPTWTNIERNLTLPSVRSSAIAITGAGVEYFVGTSVGLYGTTDPATTNWAQEAASTLGNAVVSSLSLRTSDNNMAVGTHGYGMWRAVLTSALPIKLVEFTGKPVNKINRLNWISEQEQDNRGFEVQRKYPHEAEFSTIGFVKGTNLTTRSQYQFDDIAPDLGKSNAFYRLKQLDLDGRFTYSPVISINRKVSENFIEYVSSQNGLLYVRVNGNNQNRQFINLRIFDGFGRLVKQQQLKSISQFVDISMLSKANYAVEFVSDKKERFVQQIIR